MSRLVLSVWLAGAALYTVFTLVFTQSLHGYAPNTFVGETVRAKNVFAAQEVILPLEPAPRGTRHGAEWVQAARYMAVVRARPSAAAPVLFAATFGRPLRVIGREGGFARVQDLGTGQLGWIETRSLARFFGGYRERKVAPSIVVVASKEAAEAPEIATVAALSAPAKPEPAAARSETRPRPKEVAMKAAWDGSVFRRQRFGAQRIADRRGGFAGIMQRAFRGF